MTTQTTHQPDSKSVNYIVFTDLDGTLLDHESYSHDAAKETLRELDELGVPVIPVTSKTRAEVLQLREEIGLCSPFVVENGAAIYVPKGYFSFNADSLEDAGDFWCKSFSPERSFWVELLASLPISLADAFTGFSELGDEGVARVTGLTLDAAKKANQREFSEPVWWHGTPAQKKDFVEIVQSKGFTVLEGGRFTHLTTGYDKGKALVWLKQQFQRQLPDMRQQAIALGDSGNDIDMLEAADQPIVIRNDHNPKLYLNSPVAEIRSSLSGPEGWAETLSKYLDLKHLKAPK